jgi:hypothetical protein
VNSSAASSEEVTIASEWPVPWVLMCSIASPTESTTPIAIFIPRYSVSQSSAFAIPTATDPAFSRVRSSPTSSTPASESSWTTGGKSALATFRWTSSVSAELQTPGRWTFAL